MSARRLAEVAIAMLVILFVLACIIWPVVPYIVAWWALFDAWKFSLQMNFWRSLVG